MSIASRASEPRPGRPASAGPGVTVNDLAIRIGTVNGSGSQSANLVLLRALHRMGIPCSGKNVFPSNIEGLPTWFHLRASRYGYIGHQPRPQVLVCMHEPSAVDDLRALPPGAVGFYRDDFVADLSTVRPDVLTLPVPFARLAAEAYPPEPDDAGYRDKLRKVVNMVYVGVLTAALGIDPEAIEAAILHQFPGRKGKAAAVNIAAAGAGLAWGREHLPETLPYRVERMDGTTGTILIDGNQAAALGAVFGGVSVLTWYPITPSSSLAESAEGLLQKHRRDAQGQATYAIVQAEDELAAIGMAVGAGWAGARSLTATSGPGISLMAEFVGLAYFAEIPVVIVDVQRMGPSTGLPTRTSQGDLLKLHLLGHGDCRHPVLIPGSPSECFSLTAQAPDLAQQFQTPVFVASDLDLGMNLWMSERFAYPVGPLQRGKVLDADDLERLGQFARYRDVDGDGIGYRTLPGTEHPLAAYFTRGTGHNEQSGYSERPADWQQNLDRLNRKLETARAALPEPVWIDRGGAIGLIVAGSSHWAAVEALDQLQEAGLPTDLCRIRALPLSDAVLEFVAEHERTYIVEQNRDAQLASLVRLAVRAELVPRLVPVGHYDGTPIAAVDITGPILAHERPERVAAVPASDPEGHQGSRTE